MLRLSSALTAKWEEPELNENCGGPIRVLVNESLRVCMVWRALPELTKSGLYKDKSPFGLQRAAGRRDMTCPLRARLLQNMKYLSPALWREVWMTHAKPAQAMLLWEPATSVVDIPHQYHHFSSSSLSNPHVSTEPVHIVGARRKDFPSAAHVSVPTRGSNRGGKCEVWRPAPVTATRRLSLDPLSATEGGTSRGVSG